MQLDKNNGQFTFGDLVIDATVSNIDIERLSNQFIVKHGYKNGDYRSYSILNVENGEISVSVNFYKQKLSSLNICLGKRYQFTPFVLTNEEKLILKNKLLLIWGEKKYIWGSVEFNEDYKGCMMSIIIKYL